ncbi:MAG: hypothetical protein Q7R77_00955 [Candidatus Daviesbacteria bacterium]|nr:hypothetical protein [Candidatus Daviesbacteria bacterium]
MRKFILCLSALFLIISFALANISSVEAAQKVKGYIKKNGTYVAPHFKTSPNKSKFDNFSTKGNINPYTGKKGAVSPFKITPKKYR